MPGVSAVVLALVLTGFQLACVQFDSNRNCPVIDLDRA